MATVDEEGYFTIVDRKKDLIIRGGYNVYPREGVVGLLVGRASQVMRSCRGGGGGPGSGDGRGGEVCLTWVHPNTVYSRLEHFGERTGRDIRQIDALIAIRPLRRWREGEAGDGDQHSS